MKLSNIEELRERTKLNLFSNIHKGYICIGERLSGAPSLSSRYGIPTSEMNSIHTHNKVMEANYSGDSFDREYFVTEQFYNDHIKEDKPMELTATEKYTELSKSYIKLMGIKTGSLVKVTHKVETQSNGWEGTWIEGRMDQMVGNEGSVSAIAGNGNIQINHGYWYPFFCLAPVVKKVKVPDPIKISADYEVIFKPDASIEVGCQKIPYNLLMKIANAATNIKGQL